MNDINNIQNLKVQLKEEENNYKAGLANKEFWQLKEIQQKIKSIKKSLIDFADKVTSSLKRIP